MVSRMKDSIIRENPEVRVDAQGNGFIRFWDKDLCEWEIKIWYNEPLWTNKDGLEVNPAEVWRLSIKEEQLFNMVTHEIKKLMLVTA